jgi:peptidoglycan/xylan/chitin deacetylase (PgdA/CDA1 family)
VSDGTAWDEAAWLSFAAELDAWRHGGRTATFWWRDDDAGALHPGLPRLLDLAARHRVPLGVAAVPAWLAPEAAALLAAAPAGVVVLQHGWAHVNHETTPPPGERKIRPAECGAARPPDVVLAELAAGWACLRGALGTRTAPVLVPPWNRIAAGVVAGLPAIGYRALSTFGAGVRAPAAGGLARLDCHADPIVWREDRRFVGAAATLTRLTAHLTARREGRADPDAPTGLLTHHRDMGPAFWEFLDAWLGRLAGHAAARFPPLPTLIAGAPALS